MKALYIILGIIILGFAASFFFLSGDETLEDTSVVRNGDEVASGIDLPRSLLRYFPDTDWSRVDSSMENILSGGPGKDGIPAIDDPEFIPLSEFNRPDSVLAMVMRDGEDIKVYPYNILIWHEIVNDVVDEVPVAITFCPLCGSAIAFERTLPGGVTTLGVSGFLIESNMVMYDRDTESLWQQSTGEALAGEYFGEQLELAEFQLMDLGEIRERLPNALVLSENTGHDRDYGRNPYAGYEESDDFIFGPSDQDDRYDPKDIFVIFRVNGTVVGVPWLALEEGETYQTEISGENIALTKEGSELSIENQAGERVPFYFEMWFSFYVQNKDQAEVFDPTT